MAVLGGILSLGGILLTGYPQPASRQVLLSIGALGLLQYFFQPAALLLLARRLKRRPGGGLRPWNCRRFLLPCNPVCGCR